MATKQEREQNIHRMRRGGPSVSLPGSDIKVNLPGPAGLVWYAGIGAMAALELIEWPIALVISATHFVESHSHSRDVQELADGIESGV